MSVVEARDALVVTGPDTTKYLQGQLSNDVAGLADGASCWSFLLEPSGKFGQVLRARRVDAERIELDLDRGTGAAAEARLRRFLIRTKVTIESASVGVDLDGAGDGVELVGWWGEGVVRLTTAPPSPDADVAARRVAAGWPAAGAEVLDGVIPGESGLVPVAVSFTKGCYTGQELVARIDSRGNSVPHLVRRVRLSEPAEPGTPVVVDGQDSGRLTTVAGLDALAMVHRRVEVPAAATVGGAPADITEQRAG